MDSVGHHLRQLSFARTALLLQLVLPPPLAIRGSDHSLCPPQEYRYAVSDSRHFALRRGLALHPLPKLLEQNAVVIYRMVWDST